MAVPTTREQFKDYCLRRLGYPVIDINVSTEQIDDRIDDSLLYYHDYHFDGSERILLKHQVTQQNMDDSYIQMGQDIIGVVDLLPLNSSSSSSSLFNLNYQIHLNDMYYTQATPLLPYYMVKMQLANLHKMFVGEQPLRYNRHVNKLHIDMDWGSRLAAGDYIVIDCYRIADPEIYSDVWNDRWLQRYATAQIKRQWGQNLIKFEGMQLPGGVQFNGQKIHDDAVEEINRLEEEMITSYSLPVNDIIG
jgi:hypothetical protein